MSVFLDKVRCEKLNKTINNKNKKWILLELLRIFAQHRMYNCNTLSYYYT
jgi:hypothetical protein